MIVFAVVFGSPSADIVAFGPAATAAAASGPQPDSTDLDGDSLPDEWEAIFGLDPQSATGANGVDGDPDGDGLSNGQELAGGTHPRGLFQRYFAEGAQSGFFRTRLAFANGFANADARVLVTLLGPNGERVPMTLVVPAHSHRHVEAGDIPNLPTDFAVHVESDLSVAVERTMTWDGRGYASHAESGVAQLSRRWYLAEGATGGPFSLYYLVANPNATPARVTINYLLPAPQNPIVRSYDVGPHTRRTIWVDLEAPELAATDVGAVIEADVDVVVERAMYRDTDQALGAGHAAAAVPAPATSWFLAEGATGPFFDLYILIANPSTTASDIEVTYLLPAGPPLVKLYTAAPLSRTTLRVDDEDPLLVNTPVSVRVRSRNDVPVVVERAMWWPDGAWYEAHASAGTLKTGTRWLAADAEVGGAAQADTYILIANTATCNAVVDVTLLFGSDAPVKRQFGVRANSRFNVDLRGEFTEALDRRFGVLVESVGACIGQLVVERATYTSADGLVWSGGANATALEISPLLLPQGSLILHSEGGPHVVDVRRPGGPPGTIVVESSNPAVATAVLDPETGRLTIIPGSASQGSVTITLTGTAPGLPPEATTFEVFVHSVRPVQFSEVHTVGPRLLFPAIADFNKDGWPEMFGTMNDGTGVLTPVDLTAAGVFPLVDEIRDNRVADFNGDGWLDVVTGHYKGVDDAPWTRLFVNNGDNTWHEDPAFSALGLKGYIHTIVVADFDNDGDLDLFMPVYTQNDPREQFFLLLNDGAGGFTEVADAAGISNRDWPYEYKTEGAHAVDFDGDGWIDVYTASRFFFNNGVTNGIPTFTDRAAELGLPLRYDEGLKFTDWNNDGKLDLVKHSEWTGPYLYEFDGQRFTERFVFPPLGFFQAYGINIADINNDGYEDIVTAGGVEAHTAVLLNAGSRFLLNEPTTISGWANDCLAFGDFNRDGLLDIGKRDAFLVYVLNTTPATTLPLVIEVVGDDGQQNQHGRVVRVTPLSRPEITYTRIVDGGSGYIAQSEYAVSVASQLPGPFRVVVQFDDGSVEFVMEAGQRRRVYRNGQVHSLP